MDHTPGSDKGVRSTLVETQNWTKHFSSGLNKEDHMIIAQRLGMMEKRRVGTRFIDREATEEDQAKPLMQVLADKGINCSVMWHRIVKWHQMVTLKCDIYHLLRKFCDNKLD